MHNSEEIVEIVSATEETKAKDLPLEKEEQPEKIAIATEESEKAISEAEKVDISSVEASVEAQEEIAIKEDIETSQTDMKYEIPSVASSDKDISISEEEKEDIDEESSSEEESRIDQEKVMKARENAEKLLKTIDDKIPTLNSASKAERRKNKLETAFQAIARGEEMNIEKVLHQAEKNAQRDAIFAAAERGERLDMTKLDQVMESDALPAEPSKRRKESISKLTEKLKVANPKDYPKIQEKALEQLKRDRIFDAIERGERPDLDEIKITDTTTRVKPRTKVQEMFKNINAKIERGERSGILDILEQAGY